MIPQGLADTHFRQAAVRIDREGIPPARYSVHYDVVIDGKRYPPKYLVSLAALFATGTEYPPSEFNAVEAKNHFLSRGYQVIDRRAETRKVIVEEDDESVFPEGRILYETHRRLERDGAVSRKAKARRLLDTGHLACEVCDTDFAAIYGKVGEGYIEAHHIKPVSTLDGYEKTKISDLALVCPNCHRMLHRSTPPLTVTELKKIYIRSKERSGRR